MIAAGTVVFVLVASQVLVPQIAERTVENRLTAGGGAAEATVGAMPALRLLFGSGERFEIDAHGLDLPLDQDLEVFRRMSREPELAAEILYFTKTLESPSLLTV